MEFFMLKVPCGISGKVRIVKENSITGEVTHDSEFSNIWTDLGLARLSVPSSKPANWPTSVHWGSGVQPMPHNTVTSLASRVSYGNANFGVDGGISYDSGICIVTRTVAVTQNARGVVWSLSELGLSTTAQEGSLDTYTLVKNSSGVPEPVTVSAIEIITIYYTIQIQYPMSLPPQAVTVVGLPPTTATFTLRPERSGFATQAIAAVWYARPFEAFTNENFGGTASCTNVGNVCRWGINELNKTTEYFGTSTGAAYHVWKVSPPITKNNTQVLELEITWTFSNAAPIEIP